MKHISLPAPIVLQNLTKRYGSSRGVEDISLTVQGGQVFGFLGPNGAGKSTTISMLVNLTRPSSGSIILFGEDSRNHGISLRSRIGYIAGEMALDAGLTGLQQLEYFGHLRGSYNKKYIHELAGRLHCNLKPKIKTLSRGNRQKIALISAFMHKPELLILDEPTSGLDPLMQAEFNKLVLEHKSAGRTTFISSHALGEVQELCDQVAFIREGTLIVNKPLVDIVKGAPKLVRVSVKHAGSRKKLSELTGIKNLTEKGSVLEATYEGDITALLRRLANIDVRDVSIQDAELETIFAKYYEAENV